MSFRSAQTDVDAWISQFEEGYWKPLSMLARVTEETGELAREINHRFGEKPKKPGEPEQDIGEEISDIIFVLLSLANSLEIDMDQAWDRMMEKYRTRDKDRWTRK
jgi:NTP pyrophosphatase (non-canonical NTP hydrolase)